MMALLLRNEWHTYSEFSGTSCSEIATGDKTNGKSIIRIRQGGMYQANKDFNSLGPKNVKDIINKKGHRIKVVTLPSGKVVKVRKYSSDDRPTLEVRNAISKRGYEFRYNK